MLTRSLELTLKNVLLASVATALARYDLPVPGGPYSRIPLQGVRLPVNRWGNLMGRITASLSDALAPSRPATSSHLTFGFSDKIAPVRAPRNFFISGSWSPSPSPSFLSRRLSHEMTRNHTTTHFLPPPPAPLTDPSTPMTFRARFSPAEEI